MEYVLLMSMVALVLVAMTPMLRRGIQAIVKETADQLAPQNFAEQSVNDTAGWLVSSITVSNISSKKDSGTLFSQKAPYYQILDIRQVITNSVVNLGFTNTEIPY